MCGEFLLCSVYSLFDGYKYGWKANVIFIIVNMIYITVWDARHNQNEEEE
jgi:hypothetical protein